MKKRMFITTIVMMLVLAVALTTSSLAWFSSANTSVTATSATFYASTASDSNVNLKISNSPDSWGNQITLTSATERAMIGVIPTKALIAEYDDNYAPAFTGVEINGVATPVAHDDYIWPARIEFNAAKINSESKFVIDTNNTVDNYANLANNNNNGAYYYKEFYIHNADSNSSISSLTFNTIATLRVLDAGDSAIGNANSGDYTCNAYAAFIIFDQVNIAIGDQVTANALDNAGKTVVETNAELEQAPTTSVLANVTVGENSYYAAWVPFAAFTFAVDNSGTNTEQAWQFADLDDYDGDGVADTGYNEKLISSLKTQDYDALAANAVSSGFVLNTTSLRQLNDKIKVASGDNEGKVLNTNTVRDDASTFSMPAGEIYKVALYYWLDGYTMTAFTDTTVASISVQIDAAH